MLNKPKCRFLHSRSLYGGDPFLPTNFTNIGELLLPNDGFHKTQQLCIHGVAHKLHDSFVNGQ